MWKSKNLSGKASRTAMPHSRARTPPIPCGSSRLRCQTGVSPSSTWTWSSEKGQNRTSQSRPSCSPFTRASWALRAKGQR